MLGDVFQFARMIVTTPVILMAIFLGAVLSIRASDAQVAQGTYEYRVYQSEQLLHLETHRFAMQYDGCRWHLEYADSAAVTNDNVLNASATAASDGTNIYKIQFHSESAVRKAWKEQYEEVKTNLPLALVHIFPGSSPPPKETVAYHLWFLLLAGCHLTNSTGTTKPPFAADDALYRHPDYSCQYWWTTNPASGLSSLVLSNLDGRVMGRDPQGKIVSGITAPPLDKGYQVATANWNRITNSTDHSVAELIEFAAYAPGMAPDAKSPTARLVKAYEIRCTVTNRVTGALSPIPPALPNGKVLVTDERFADDGYANVGYVVTNLWYASDDSFIRSLLSISPRLTREDQARRKYSLAPATAARSRSVIWILLVLPMGLLAVLGAILKQNRAKTKGIA